MKRIATTAALASLLAASAFADPLPQGIKPGFSGANLDVAQHTTQEQATLTLKGVGVCENFKIVWGDGSAETVTYFDFGYGASSAALVRTHQYTKPGTYFPSYSEIKGPTLSQQCGAGSTYPISNVKITSSTEPTTAATTSTTLGTRPTTTTARSVTTTTGNGRAMPSQLKKP